MHIDPSPSPGPHHPALPPGLSEEGDSSDLSDPPFPITPSQSPIMAHTQPIEVIVSTLEHGHASAIPSSSGPPPTASKGKGLLGTIRRTPSLSTRTSPSINTGGPNPRRSLAERSPRPMSSSATPAINDDELRSLLTPPTPATPVVNGKEREKAHKEPERKPSTWFKRKSFRMSDKLRTDAPGLDAPSSPVMPSHEATASSPTSTLWFRSGQARDIKERRPSEPSFFDAIGHDDSSPRPKSTGEGLTVKADRSRHRTNGSETPSPGSASSSFGSTSLAHSGPAPSFVYEFPPPRKSSMPPETEPPVPKSPSHKKSLSSFPGQKEKSRGPPSVVPPPRPSTAGPSSSSGGTSPRPLPPVPPLPPAVTILTQSDNQVLNSLSAEPESFLEKGKTKLEGGEMDGDSPGGPSPPMGSLGLAAIAGGANNSTSSTSSSNASSNLRRATRKLSLTAPMLGLGFGRKDKHKDRDREKEKVAPTFSNQFSMGTKM